jgi:LEA14-like dessication related protein
MKNGVIFGLLAAAGAAFYFIRGKKELVNQLEVNLLSIKLDRARTRQAAFLNLFFDIRLRLFNPTPNSLQVKHIFIEIFIDGKMVGSVTKPDDFDIRSNTESIINFTAKINTFNLGSSILKVLQTGEDFNLAAAGYIDTSFGRVPFQKEF